MLGLNDAAKVLGISPRGLHDLASNGEIPTVRTGGGKRAGRLLFRLETLRAWAAKMERGQVQNDAPAA